MSVMAVQMGGLALSVLGWMGTFLACALPMWKVTAFIGSNIVVAQVFWEGLWMNCVYESTGQMQCKIYDSLLDLSSDLQGFRCCQVSWGQATEPLEDKARGLALDPRCCGKPAQKAVDRLDVPACGDVLQHSELAGVSQDLKASCPLSLCYSPAAKGRWREQQRPGLCLQASLGW
ncbi:claudin-4-like isoform X2 [Lepidochelys kempii]|uniref:claudin-4-like isoform X2 n=1 Tax=Lepidochelys kempii TaxID=8472 RepID=UPI003C705E90